MSDPEVTSRRGLLGNAVASKAMLYRQKDIRDLLFFLQARSLVAGGMSAVAAALIEKRPALFHDERLRRQVMRALHVGPKSTSYARRLGAEIAAIDHGVPVDERDLFAEDFEEFLTAVCLDPAFDVEQCVNKEEARASGEPKPFHDVIALLQSVRQSISFQDIEPDFAETSISRDVHEMLDHGQRRGRGIVVIEGMPGLGKSKAARTWAGVNSGTARFVSLTGINSKTRFFQLIATAIGLGTAQRKSFELQAKIEDWFAATRIGLVIDEAHFCWPQAQRVYSNPEIIDWIDTALVNAGVPVALICTPQFSKIKARVEKQTGWAAEQFLHRVRRFRRLADRPTKSDLKAVAEAQLAWARNEEAGAWQPGAEAVDKDSRDMVVGYALASHQPFSAVADAVEEARILAEERGDTRITFDDVAEAVQEHLVPSAAAMRESFDPTPKRTAASSAASKKPSKAFVIDRTPTPSRPVEVSAPAIPKRAETPAISLHREISPVGMEA